MELSANCNIVTSLAHSLFIAKRYCCLDPLTVRLEDEAFPRVFVFVSRARGPLSWQPQSRESPVV